MQGRGLSFTLLPEPCSAFVCMSFRQWDLGEKQGGRGESERESVSERVFGAREREGRISCCEHCRQWDSPTMLLSTTSQLVSPFLPFLSPLFSLTVNYIL